MVRYTDLDDNRKFRLDLTYESEGIVYPWSKWYAWYPIKVNGNLLWLTHVYRRKVIYTIKGGQGYEYGTVFDLLKD